MSLQRTILVVEDQDDLAEMLRFNLDREGYSCRCVADGAIALQEAKRNPPDLVLLDRMLPGLSGDDVITRLKRDPATALIPIIMLTAKADESDELVGFALGADDYVTKPFSMKSLLARIAARLRRPEKAGVGSETLRAGPFAMNISRHEVTVNNVPIALTATEFRLLGTLMAANGRVLSRSKLIDAALGSGVVVTDRTIDVHITAVRKKVGGVDPALHASGWIQTVRGVGYTFRPPQEA